MERWLPIDITGSHIDSLTPLLETLRHQHTRLLVDDNDLLDGPRSPIGNGDYIDLDALQSHGEHQFFMLNDLEPPASLVESGTDAIKLSGTL
jgi:hypothetical protein